MKIQILGTGCAKCQKLAAVAEEAAKGLGLTYEIEKVTEIQRIMTFGVMSTPALVVGGQVKVEGKVPSLEETKKLLVPEGVPPTKSISFLRSFLIGSVCLSMSVAGLRATEIPSGPETQAALPLLVDLGAGKCVPCKLMAPILAELEKDYAGQLKVVFIDVWNNRAEGERYGVLVIPTQIFYDATGKERFRHEGFMAKKDILAKWEELGVPLQSPAENKG